MRAYELRHIVSFEETNLVGNVYYANHVRWQGRCREMFLMDHAPAVLDEFARGLFLVTTRVSCEYFEELRAFDEVLVRMTAKELTASRVTMGFEYLQIGKGGERKLIARGEQQVASMRHENGRAVVVALPGPLRDALLQFKE